MKNTDDQKQVLQTLHRMTTRALQGDAYFSMDAIVQAVYPVHYHEQCPPDRERQAQQNLWRQKLPDIVRDLHEEGYVQRAVVCRLSAEQEQVYRANLDNGGIKRLFRFILDYSVRPVKRMQDTENLALRKLE